MKNTSKEVLQIVKARLGLASLGPDDGAFEFEEEPEVEIAPAAAATTPNSSDLSWLNAANPGSGEKLANEFQNRNQEGEIAPDLTRLLAHLTNVQIPAGDEQQGVDEEEQSVAEPEPRPVRRQPQKQRPFRAFAAGFPSLQRSRLQSLLERGVVSELEFITVDELSQDPEISSSFDLLVINVASMKIVQKNRDCLIEALRAGRPALLTGSRTTIKHLNLEAAQGSTWDFLPTPWDTEDLLWRAQKLLQQPASVMEPTVSTATPAAIAAPAPPRRTRKAAPDAAVTHRVLIADSDPVSRALIEATIASTGACACSAVEDGDAAMQSIRAHGASLIVMDLALPNRDGFQLLADIKRSSDLRDTKVIILSARQAEVDILRAFGLGADDYVTKPFSPLELRARVLRLLIRNSG